MPTIHKIITNKNTNLQGGRGWESFYQIKSPSSFTSGRKTELKLFATIYSADYWLVSQTQGELAIVQLGHSTAASDGAITHYQLCRL